MTGRKSSLLDSRAMASITMVTLTLFSLAICKMHVRHLGYEVVKLAKEMRIQKDQLKTKTLAFSRLLRPDRIERMASVELELTRAAQGQVIQMGNQRVVLRQ